MLRHLLSAITGLNPAVIAVSAAALVVATGLASGHLPALAQNSVPLVVFEEGDTIERFVKENSPAGESVGPPVAATGGGQLTYSLSGDDAASFTIVTDTGQILVGQGVSLDYESDKKSYSIIVTATGQPGQTASAKVTVIVDPFNEPPEFDILNISFELFKIKENSPPGTKIGDPITATDPEDDDVTYSLTGTNAGLFDVDADGQVMTKASLNYEAASTYQVKFTASDSQSNSASVDLTIKVMDVDTEAPGKPVKPMVGPNPGNGHEALAVTWAAPENEGPPISSYVVQYRVEGSDTEWKQVTIDGNGVETTISGLAADAKYEAQVRAINEEGEGEWSGSGQGSTFASRPVNTPPEFDVNATSTLSVSENSQPGTAIGGPFTASDSDGQDVLNYSLAGTDSGLFSVDDLSGQISVGPGIALDHESPSDSGGDNVYDLTVQVTDGKDEQGDPDNSVDDEIGVTVRVTDVNEPPEFVSSATELETDENIATSLASFEATDPEGHTVSWSLDPASPDGGNFSLSVTGTLMFKTAPDYESTTDVDRSNDYDIIVVATDDGQPPASSRVSLTIRVVNIDEAGVVSLSTLGPQMGVAITAKLADPDGGVTGASWQWLSYLGSQERAIAGATDSSYTPTTADSGSRLQATVSYTDAHGSGKYAVGPESHPVGDDSNSPPVFAAGAIVARQVAENTRADKNIGYPVTATDPDNDYLTYSLSGTGSDMFGIVDSSGQIKTSSPLDHESQPEFRLTVTATDPGGLAVSAEIIVTVTDIDTEAPGTPDAPSVAPNRDDPIGAIDVSWAVPLNTGPKITGYVVRYRVEGSGEESTQAPQIDGNRLEITISGLLADTEYAAQVHAVNAEGTGIWSKAGLGSTLATIPVNTPPEFDEGPIATRSVEENAPADTMIGDPVTATDPNNDELAYTLAGPDSRLFHVDSLSGQISIGAGTALDHESPAHSGGDNVYELTVQVTDGKDAEGIPDNLIDDEIGVTVTVTDVNEPPEFTSSAVELEIEENSSFNTNVGNPIIATDPESAALTYSLTGADADSFDVDASTGQIRILAPLDYEDQNAFALIMIATDEGDLMTGIAVTIHVINVNEAPIGATAIEDRTVIESDGVNQFDVSAHFNDPDADELIYTATSSDSEVARVGFIGAALAVTPAGIGTTTVEVTATDPAGLSFDQSFTVQVVAAQGGSGGFIPFIPSPPQESGDLSGSGIDQVNLLSENPAVVRPAAVLLTPGQTVILQTIAFNLLGDHLPASAVGVACTWSSDGGGSFTNGSAAGCSTTFTAPAEGNGTITARVTQGRIATHGVGAFEVIAPLDTTPGVEEEEVPDIRFPASVAGSIVSQPGDVLITSPKGLTMEIPAGAIDDYYLGAYIEDLASSEVDVPEDSDFIVGSHAGNFVFTDVAGNPIPGFRTNLPVRICLPITREDIDMAAGGIGGIRVVYQTQDGEFFRHPPDNDEANMVTCANVDRFSLYFVGLAVPSPIPEPTHAPTATPGPTPTPTLVPSPVTTPESTPVLSAIADPTPEETPVLPITGDTTPGPQALLLIAIAAAIALITGLTIRRLFRQHRSA